MTKLKEICTVSNSAGTAPSRPQLTVRDTSLGNLQQYRVCLCETCAMLLVALGLLTMRHNQANNSTILQLRL